MAKLFIIRYKINFVLTVTKIEKRKKKMYKFLFSYLVASPMASREGKWQKHTFADRAP